MSSVEISGFLAGEGLGPSWRKASPISNQYDILKKDESTGACLLQVWPDNSELIDRLEPGKRVIRNRDGTTEEAPYPDRNYPLRSRRELTRRRIGGDLSTKRLFLLLDSSPENNPDWKIAVTLFTDWSWQPVTHGVVLPRHLRGDIKTVLKSRPRGVKKPNLITCYTINSYHNDINGRLMVRLFYSHISEQYPGVVISTLSPLPGYDPRQETVLRHLLRNVNPVQRFHMGNGAYIGNTQDHMVNFVYPPNPDELEWNKECYRRGYLVTSKHVQDQLGVEHFPPGAGDCAFICREPRHNPLWQPRPAA